MLQSALETAFRANIDVETLPTVIRELLREEGFSDEELARIHTPIGLDIGGKSSAEVALAIIGEIVAVQRGRRV